MSAALILVTLTPCVLMYLVHSPVLATVDILEMDLLVKVSIKIIVTRIAHTCNKHALIPSN